MKYTVAVFAGVSLFELKREYFGSIFANTAQPAFLGLTDLAFVEVALQNPEVTLNLFRLMTIVDVVEVLEAEKVAFEDVVDLFAEGFVHEIRVANRIVHQMQLPLQHQEVIKLLMLQHHDLVITELNDGSLVVESDPFVGLFAHLIASQIEIEFGFVRHLDALGCHAVVAEPFA